MPTPSSDALSNTLPKALLVLGSIMLVCTVMYPFGYDQAAFAVAGDMISKLGSVPYRDFLDTKPPVIFYLYSLAGLLFGHHEWSVRVFDVLYQGLLSFYLFRIVERYTGRATSVSAVGLYLMMYAGTGFWMTAQAESFSTLPSLLLIDATLRVTEGKSGWRWGVLAGLALALLFFLKFTLITALIAVAAFVLLRNRTRAGRNFLIMATGVCGALLVAFASALSAAGALDRLLESFRWLASYSSIDPLFGGVTIAQRYNEAFVARFVTTCSLAVVLLSISTTWRVARNRISESGSKDLLLLMVLVVAAHSLGILSERKMFPYHYARLFFAVAILAAVSLPDFIEVLANKWSSVGTLPSGLPKFLRIVLLGGVGFLALFYSPAVKFVIQSIPWSLVAIEGKDAHAEVQKRTEEYFAADQSAVADYLKRSRTSSMFLWGNDVGIYYFANTLPTTFCLTATPFRTTWTPDVWRAQLLQQLSARPPEWFIIEHDDAKSFITGSDEDSFTALTKWHALAQFVATGYRTDTTIGHFYLYRRAALSR